MSRTYLPFRYLASTSSEAEGDAADVGHRWAVRAPVAKPVVLALRSLADIDRGSREVPSGRSQIDPVPGALERLEERIEELQRPLGLVLADEDVDQLPLRRAEVTRIVRRAGGEHLAGARQDGVRGARREGALLRRHRRRCGSPRWTEEMARLTVARSLQLVSGPRIGEGGLRRRLPDLQLGPVPAPRSRNVQTLTDTPEEAGGDAVPGGHLEHRLGPDLLEQCLPGDSHDQSAEPSAVYVGGPWTRIPSPLPSPIRQDTETTNGNDPAGIRTRVCAVRGHRPDH